MNNLDKRYKVRIKKCAWMSKPKEKNGLGTPLPKWVFEELMGTFFDHFFHNPWYKEQKN